VINIKPLQLCAELMRYLIRGLSDVMREIFVLNRIRDSEEVDGSGNIHTVEFYNLRLFLQTAKFYRSLK